MTEYNNNETVTISLERYEELKSNQKKFSVLHDDHEDTKLRAVQEYLDKNGLTFFWNPQEYKCPIEVITKEEAKKREEKMAEERKDFIKKVVG